MTSESEFLPAALRREDIVAPATADWQALLELADSHGVDSFLQKVFRQTAWDAC
jgi:hypothetical protein